MLLLDSSCSYIESGALRWWSNVPQRRCLSAQTHTAAARRILWFSHTHTHTSVCFAHFFHTLTCFYSVSHTPCLLQYPPVPLNWCVCVCLSPGFSRVVVAAVALWDCVPLPLGRLWPSLHCGQGRESCGSDPVKARSRCVMGKQRNKLWPRSSNRSTMKFGTNHESRLMTSNWFKIS